MIYKLTKKILNFFLEIFYFIKKNDKIYFSGIYNNWEDAKKNSKGYDDQKILERVKYSTSMLSSGKAIYERDGIILKKNEFPYQILSIILRSSIENKNKCKVIDFGGSLGSTYYNNKSFFKYIKNLKWTIVEQNNFTKIGNKFFANKIVNFCNSIDEASKYFGKPNVIILSGVIQYLPNPYSILKKIINANADYIVVDRCSFLKYGKTKLTIQKIPRKIIKTSYPIWLFNQTEFKKKFKEKYKELATFDSLDGVLGYGKLKTYYKGIIYKNINVI
jgi:putative methyltransferase (TIGR04325 family)